MHGEDITRMQSDEAREVVLPVIAQALDVTTRKVETGRVRITKEVREREEAVEAPLVRERIHVERVPIDQVVTELPATRQEGDTLIVPVVEEEIVIEKRLILKEELRITKTRVVEPRPAERVSLRSEEVRVERVPAREDDQEKGAG